MSNMLGKGFLKELEAEAPSSRKCLERIPGTLFDWQPHEKSMKMGYLALLVAEIPLWITAAIEAGEINFGTFKHIEPKTTRDLVEHFDENMKHARKLLPSVTDAAFEEPFYLKAGDKTIFSSTKKDMAGSTINHLVHHRGQLTVYMRLNNIPVPSIYGPTADEKSF